MRKVRKIHTSAAVTSIRALVTSLFGVMSTGLALVASIGTGVGRKMDVKDFYENWPFTKRASPVPHVEYLRVYWAQKLCNGV